MSKSKNEGLADAGQKIRVVIVEDHPEYREVLQLAIETTDDIELVGIFGAAEIAHRSLQAQGSEESPDVILLELNLPGVNGLEAIPLFASSAADANVIILTQSNQRESVTKAISLGASGYLLKSATVDQVVDGIREVMQGNASLDPSVAKFLLNTLKSVMPTGQSEGLLTNREMEILRLLADGLTKKEIASRLEISPSTVSHHAVHIFEKLDVQNAPAAIARAFRLGLFLSK